MQILTITCVIAATLGSSQNSDIPTFDDSELRAWQEAVEDMPLPGLGCYEASAPAIEWRSVPCADVRPTMPHVVGGGFNRAILVNGSTIYRADGQIASSNATSVIDSITLQQGNYSLQVNSNRFITSKCNTAANPSTCRGWQQFVYENRGPNLQGLVFMEYWLTDYNNSCPLGWVRYPNSSGPHCWTASSVVSFAPAQPSVSTLNGMQLSGKGLHFGGGLYSGAAVITIGGTAYAANNPDTYLNLFSGGQWTAAEFNVYGAGNGSRANFGPGTTISLRLSVAPVQYNGTSVGCIMASTIGSQTSETNNLQLDSLCLAQNATMFTNPRIMYGERN